MESKGDNGHWGKADSQRNRQSKRCGAVPNHANHRRPQKFDFAIARREIN
jgi:hypothetical protein